MSKHRPKVFDRQSLVPVDGAGCQSEQIGDFRRRHAVDEDQRRNFPRPSIKALVDQVGYQATTQVVVDT